MCLQSTRTTPVLIPCSRLGQYALAWCNKLVCDFLQWDHGPVFAVLEHCSEAEIVWLCDRRVRVRVRVRVRAREGSRAYTAGRSDHGTSQPWCVCTAPHCPEMQLIFTAFALVIWEMGLRNVGWRGIIHRKRMPWHTHRHTHRHTHTHTHTHTDTHTQGRVSISTLSLSISCNEMTRTFHNLQTHKIQMGPIMEIKQQTIHPFSTMLARLC